MDTRSIGTYIDPTVYVLDGGLCGDWIPIVNRRKQVMQLNKLKQKGKHLRKRDRIIRFEKLVDQGCIACWIEGYGPTPPEIHHIREGYGMGQRAPDEETIPLCPRHHRYGKGRYPGIHSDPANFKKCYGSEKQLLEAVNSEI